MALTRHLTVIIGAALALASACGGGLSPTETGGMDLGPSGLDLQSHDLALGPCLLEYNDAPLTSSSGAQTTASACCYHQGDRNTCDLAAQCSATAGNGCCVVYSTDAAGLGGVCCAYENGDEGVDPVHAAACATLLTAGR